VLELSKHAGFDKYAESWGQWIKRQAGKAHDYVIGPALDVAGMIPAFGNIADAANAGIYHARGQHGNAALSWLAATPGVGLAATGAKYTNKVVKATKNTKKIKQTVPNLVSTPSNIKKNVKNILPDATPSIFKNTQHGLKGIRQVAPYYGGQLSKKIFNKMPLGVQKNMQRFSTLPGGGLNFNLPKTGLRVPGLRSTVGLGKTWAHLERPLAAGEEMIRGKDNTFLGGVSSTPIKDFTTGMGSLAGQGMDYGTHKWLQHRYGKDHIVTPGNEWFKKNMPDNNPWELTNQSLNDTTSNVKNNAVIDSTRYNNNQNTILQDSQNKADDIYNKIKQQNK